MTGYITHQTYLTAWGVDPGLFPKPANEIIMTGYFAIIDRSVSILSAFQKEATILLGSGIAITGYAFVLLRFRRSEKRERALHVLQRTPEWLGDLAKSMGVTLVVLAGVPVALFSTVFVLAIPAYFGNSFGHSHAEKEKVTFMAGCSATLITTKCIEIWKEGRPIARGFLIESSPTHIAVFDVDQMQTRALERAGSELVADTFKKDDLLRLH